MEMQGLLARDNAQHPIKTNKHKHEVVFLEKLWKLMNAGLAS